MISIGKLADTIRQSLLGQMARELEMYWPESRLMYSRNLVNTLSKNLVEERI